MLKLLGLAVGIAGGVALSQFPEFSQQYLQRLAGQADALGQVAADFDASAQKAGLTRDVALTQLSGTTFLDYRQGDMRRVFARYSRISADLTLLRAAGPLERLALPQRFRDRETLSATWADFRLAVPVTADGLISAGIGFGAGWLVTGGILSLISRPFRRSRYA